VGGALDDELINLFIAGILTAGIMLATRCMSAAQVSREGCMQVQHWRRWCMLHQCQSIRHQI
jgi:hypothetical protein